MSDLYEGHATIRRLPPRGMISIRGDLGEAAFAGALAEGGVDMPLPGTRRIGIAGERALAWMAPDELMLFLPRDQAGGAAARLSTAFAGLHAMAADVSDARALFAVEGAGAREVITKLAPVDVAPGAFGPGDFRRTRLQQIAAAFWMPGEGRFEVMCFRSVATYAWQLLTTAARPEAALGLWAGG